MYEQQSLLTADLDEIIDATGHNDAQPQEQAQKAPAVKYYPIDEETARRAHEMMSMRDYPAGRATNEYRASVDKAAALVERCKAATSPYYHGKLDALLDRYARRLAQWTNDYNRNGASCPSILVSGGSNFPVKKKQRQNAREDSLWQEYKEIEAILHKIKTVGSGPIDLADPHAREMLTDQLQQLQNRLDTGKAIYDDQYWCEIADAHGINLCFADWFFARGCAPTIMQRLPSEDAVSLAQQLKSATEENDRRFGSNSVSDRYGPIAHLYS